ncbi:4796_t:CDS:2 [Entrophospora sp. SA101]|nr:4796_t:CDS:2 [Entrophospora sp. SA101]
MTLIIFMTPQWTCDINDQLLFSVIMVYEKFTTPVFNSDLYNSTFTCHDSLTCEQRYFMNNHHQNNSINTPTPTSTSSTPNNVFISSLYSDSYLPGILLLGYTIKKHHPNHKMYLIFFPDKLSENTICQVKKIGWIPKIVERIPPPWEGVHFTFVDQFTKLQMWSFTEYDSLIYIDGDAILTNKIDHLFELVNGKTGFEFAAAPDVWNGRTTVNFNAGLMLIKPNEAVFKEIMRVHKIRGTYDIDFAEQAFLNEYFRFRGLQLPQIYNTNISMMNAYPHLWKMLLNDMKVVHYTSRKPFIKPNPGIFKEPYDLWNQLYQEMDANINLKRIEKDCRVVNNYF